MNRKEFLKKSFQSGLVSCLGISLLSSGTISAALTKIEKLAPSVTEDGFLNLFNWLSHPLGGDLTSYFNQETIEYKILADIKKGWGKKNTTILFTELSENYGEKATETMGEFIRKCTIPYWTERGKSEAKTSQEIKCFIKALWDPMGDEFKFTSNIEDGIYKFKVSKCPFSDLANQTGMHEWVYNMACITDYYMTPSFSKEIGFSREKTLTQLDDFCDHTYYTPSKKKDKALAYCGLYCGGCPGYQNSQKYKPVDFAKEEFYKTCDGCKGTINAPWCKECEIKKCARVKEVGICLDCNEFPCDIITVFKNDEKYPYHKEVENNMKRYKEAGLEKWLTEQDQKYLCKQCGNRYNFMQNECENCGVEFK